MSIYQTQADTSSFTAYAHIPHNLFGRAILQAEGRL